MQSDRFEYSDYFLGALLFRQRFPLRLRPAATSVLQQIQQCDPRGSFCRLRFERSSRHPRAIVSPPLFGFPDRRQHSCCDRRLSLDLHQVLFPEEAVLKHQQRRR